MMRERLSRFAAAEKYKAASAAAVNGGFPDCSKERKRVWGRDTTQFQSASNKKRLILGSYITQLVVSLKLLDLSDTSMHIACHMEPLDIDCLHRMGIVTFKHGHATFRSPGRIVQPKKRKRGDIEEPPRDTTSSTPETSNMHSFSRHFEDRLNRIESKVDRILAHFHIPPD
ncbi:hypothetical protein BUALT_Bualt11G0021700 [Buddleja alternifolia]|uniref:Uncharacterized protein n=1 Tax=Buddleja alternifolia TaxID=168488 RepID=A0AAV6WT77_9LAMI|nr:hypothetical protein BUALT_Bualt11G0021700 [Buddleja alternifolia]